MSKYITEKDVPLGYSSEPDEPEPKHVQDLLLTAEPYEIYVGNTGKVPFEKFYSLFKSHGTIKDMSFWRTHEHLYHTRIVYQSKDQSDRAIKLMNHRMVFSKRLRVTYVNERVKVDFSAAIRIDDLSADVTEEDIFDYFLSCGDIRFVVKIGYAAYIQFAASSSVAKALRLERSLNGDPYTPSRISANDRINHVQVIENMKDIKYRKPFVMVENYPRLPERTSLYRYKSTFESLGTVRHFKIAPTPGGTVTLALCMDDPKEREMVIDRFNNAVISQKRLKLYLAPGTARMTVNHVKQYAVAENSITVDDIRPYYTDYEVCALFRQCGSISFLEKIEGTWTICFDHPSAVSLALGYHVFKLYDRLLVVNGLSALPVLADQVKENAGSHAKLPENGNTKPSKSVSGNSDGYTKQFVKKMDENIRQSTPKISKEDAKAASVDKPTPSISQAKKRPPEDNKSDAQSTRDAQKSTNDKCSTVEVPSYCHQKLVKISNLPKGIEENDLRELFSDLTISSVYLICSRDLYHPTSVAYVGLATVLSFKTIPQRNHYMYRRKRICIAHADENPQFTPQSSIMLKNLSKAVTEEGIMEELEKLNFYVMDVLKPAHHYAYVGLTADFNVNIELLTTLRNALAPFHIQVHPLYREVPKSWMQLRSFEIKPIDKVRENCGAVLGLEKANMMDERFGVHNAHKLFVGNIPRDTQAEDVIDYFNNFGSVTDYAPVANKSCYLRKSVILSFVNPKHAQNVYRQQPHFLEGSLLDVHLMDTAPSQFPKDVNFQFITVKTHSRFLTNDEIHNALKSVLNIIHNFRFDAFNDRANFVATCKGKREAMQAVFEMKYINDEPVKIVLGYDLTPPTEGEAQMGKDISNSPYRQEKERYLNSIIYKENLKDEMEVRSKPNNEEDIAFKSFHDDSSVQINNVSLDTALEDLRDLFVKCGDIADYRGLLLKEDATKICFIKFRTDLAADLACTYSQRMVHGKRILVHLAKETLVAECDRSVLVERLNPATTAEHLHDAFARVGMVKYVQKQSPFSAIVCFKDKHCMPRAVDVTIPYNGPFVMNPCYQEYNPRFFNNFSCQEELIPAKRMRAALKPRVLPEFHQLELDRQVFENLPDDTKNRLINDVELARKRIPNFNQLSRLEQIDALKTKYQDFSQKEHFLRLTAREQEQLLDSTSEKQQQKEPIVEVIDLEALPPAPKQTRNGHPVDKKANKTFAADGYSSVSEEDEPIPDPFPSDLEPLQNIVTLTSPVQQTFPSSDTFGYPENRRAPFPMGPQSDDMFHRREEEPRYPNMYPQHDCHQRFDRGMPRFGCPNHPPMMQPGPGPMMGPPMGGMPPMRGDIQPDARLIQQRIAAMAYNAGPCPHGSMNFGRFNRPHYYN